MSSSQRLPGTKLSLNKVEFNFLQQGGKHTYIHAIKTINLLDKRNRWLDWIFFKCSYVGLSMIIPIITEQDTMGPSQDRLPHVLCLPLVCRKALVSQASSESQKAGSRINDWKNVVTKNSSWTKRTGNNLNNRSAI